MPHFARYFLPMLLIAMPAAVFAGDGAVQEFDLADLKVSDKPAEKEPELNPLDRFLFNGTFNNPVGNYVSTDEWEEDLPVVSEDGKLKVASSLVKAARHENDARALSAILAAYRDGADKAIAPTKPAITTYSGGVSAAPSSDPLDTAVRRKNRKDGNYEQETKAANEYGSNSSKQGGISASDRLGARIVANLSTFRSCSGALVSYLNHVSDSDMKTVAWTRMIRRSLGVAAIPPDDSCLQE